MRTVFATLLAISVTTAADPALPTIDDAFPPTVRIEPTEYSARIARIAVDVQPGVSWISFDVAARRASRATVRVDLPAGTQIVGMSVTSHDVRAWSALRRRDDAAERARDAGDATLLAWDGTSAGEDHVHLDVDANARVELAVLLPAVRTLAIAPRAPLIETPRGQFRSPAERIDLEVPPAEVRAYPHVTAELSLVAGAPDRFADGVVFERRFSPAPYYGGKKGIRGGFRLNQQRITNCYERSTQYGGPRVEGTVSLQFLLGVDGKVQSIDSASQLPPDITGCIEDVIAAWQFPEQDSPTIVNYPLTFRRAGD